MRNITLSNIIVMIIQALLFSNVSAKESSYFSDQVIPLQLEDFPERPKLLLEAGEDFLDTGVLSPGIELATGAVWKPTLLMFGTMRSALQTIDNGQDTSSEWANRLDLFAQLSLSPTERLVLGLRPLDKDGNFSGYLFEPNTNDGYQDETNADIDRLFFEGDFSAIFPNITRDLSYPLDIGFSIGRQPLFFQEGMLLNDTIDAVGIVRNNILITQGSNLRLTFIYGWNQIGRADNIEDDSADLYGIFSEFDFPCCTVDIDLAYVDADNAGLYFAMSSVQRIGHFNSAFRVLVSNALDQETAEVSTGLLLFSEISWSPHGTHDNAYINTFIAIDQFSSIARGPSNGGPLARAGIVFEAPGIGNVGTVLDNRASNTAGAALGYQWLFMGGRKQLIIEAGGRFATDQNAEDAYALAGRYQQAFGRHTVLRFDVFIGEHEINDSQHGIRLEWLYKF